MHMHPLENVTVSPNKNIKNVLFRMTKGKPKSHAAMIFIGMEHHKSYHASGWAGSTACQIPLR